MFGGAGQTAVSQPVEVSTLPPARQSSVCFEYTGRTAMTVIGGVTGMRYRFDYPGARLFVDLRDRLSLAAVPNIKRIHDLTQM